MTMPLLGNPSITTKYINGLVDLVHSNLQTIHADPSSIAVGAGGGAVSSSDTDLFVGSGADDGVNSGRPRSDSAASPEVALRRIQKFFLDTLQHMAEVKRRVVSADVPPGGGSAGAMEERERWNAIVLEDVLGSVSALRS